MDKNAIKKFATWARRDLIERIRQQAYRYGIENANADPYASSAHGVVLTPAQRSQRQALIERMQAKGYEATIEEVAYTWFDRFCALRFMEVNGYLPGKIRMFSDENGAFRPQILANALNVELEGLDINTVIQLKEENKTEELFKYLLLTMCNVLKPILTLFQPDDRGCHLIDRDYTWLLLPDNLLRKGSVPEQMVLMIPEDDWKDAVQIVGWLYQYYNLEPFNQLYDGEKATDKINSEELPAATQLFTPDWIVRYMVENSLGRVWLEGHPNDSLRSGWKYYLEEAEQESEVQAELQTIREQYAQIKPEEIRCIDPCMGSGHILVYMFDILVQVYVAYGYSTREAVASIVQNNLWGLDVDDRAAQMANFAVMMVARHYDKGWFRRGIQPHVMAIQESNGINRNHLNYLGNALSDLERNNAITQMNALLDEFDDAKEYGSIIHPKEYDWETLRCFIRTTAPERQITLDEAGIDSTQERLMQLIEQAQALTLRYTAIVTNPPYLNANRMNAKLVSYVKKYYAESKQDLAMILYQAVCENMLDKNALVAFITPTSWMFSAKFKDIRSHVVKLQRILSIVDCGTELFDGKVGHLYISSWVAQNHMPIGASRYVNVSEYCYSRRDEKPVQFHNKQNQGVFYQKYFEHLPDMPLSYQISAQALSYFTKDITLKDEGEARQGLTTSDNKRFTRFWFEVAYDSISWSSNKCEDTINSSKWYPFLKGGDFQKWYQRFDTVVNYQNDGREIKDSVMKKYPYLNNPGFVVKNTEWYFRPGISWNDVGGERFNARYMPSGYIFADASPSFFPVNGDIWLYLSYFNSSVFQVLANAICQGLHYSTGQIPKIPVVTDVPLDIVEDIRDLAKSCYELVGDYVNESETSVWFKAHVLMEGHGSLKERFDDWEMTSKTRISRLAEFETKINILFANIYHLEDINTYVNPNDVSIHAPDIESCIRSLVSYAVGCILGRYSLNNPSLQFAGGNWQQWLDHQKGMKYIPDKDGILPITEDEYFTDDIVTMFVEWVKIAFDESQLEDNLKFIASILYPKGNGSARELIRQYFLNDFYKDHLKIYQKRPIYWMFDSGKKNGLKCLVYMHRWEKDTVARVRTDYVHEMQSRYRTAIEELSRRVENASGSERVRLQKQLTKIQEQDAELLKYEEKVHHLADQMIAIDLDDGVKHNYALFEDVLAPLK